MDLFEDDDDEVVNESIPNNDTIIYNQIFIYLMKLKPFLIKTNKQSINTNKDSIILNRLVAILIDELNNEHINSLRDRLLKAGFIDITIIIVSNVDSNRRFDVIIDLSSKLVNYNELCLGNVIFPINNNKVINNNIWQLVNDSSCVNLSIYRYQSIRQNITSVRYWTNNDSTTFDIIKERQRISDVTVNLIESEKLTGIFSDITRNKIVTSLSDRGLCIIPELFDPHVVLNWGKATKKDLKDVMNQLIKQQDINLCDLKPNQIIDNYYELAMREPYRMDLRNGKEMNRLKQESKDQSTAYPIINNSSILNKNLCNHSSLIESLHEVMNPIDGEYARGNWGRWNFDGLGPDSKPNITIADIGAVVSLPGCVDQTIHADTSHLYTHVHLPGHYFNLFLIANEVDDSNDSYLLGQTAFVVDTHKLIHSAAVMVDEDGQKALEDKLIRPHLRPGDAVIMDCRLLHFGLANECSLNDRSNEDNWRVLLYINHHWPWFTDPKNWNNRIKLFN